MDKVLSDLILDLHRGSTTVPLCQFKHWAFEKIQAVLSFDSAVWVNGHTEDNGIITDEVYSYKQSPEIYDLREQYEEYSGLLERMMAESGITLTREMLLPRENFKDLNIYKEYFSKYDMEFALGTVKVRDKARIYSYVALYRTADGKAFTEQERRTKETLLLHMFEAYKYCLFYHYVDREFIDRRSVGKVIADGDGVIREFSDNVVDCLKLEWPNWTGPFLPDPLQAFDGCTTLEFEKLRAKFYPPKDELIVIELHPA